MMHATDSTITSPCAQVCGLQHSLPILHCEPDQNNLHRASHLLLFSSPPWRRTCALSVQKLLRDISYKQHKLYSTENDNAAAALRTAITSSLDWGGFWFLFEWRRFVLWLASLLVSVVTSLLVTGQWSTNRRHGWEAEAAPEAFVGRGESPRYWCICWWALVKVRRSRITGSRVVKSLLALLGAKCSCFFYIC